MRPLINCDGENLTFIVQSDHFGKENNEIVDMISSLASLHVLGIYGVSVECMTALSRVAAQTLELGCSFTALCHNDWMKKGVYLFIHLFL